MSKDTGGPAFPTIGYDSGAAANGIGLSVTDEPGMNLRDYFAAKALPAAWAAFDGGYFDAGEWDSINRGVAECAYQMADAMLAARVKP